MPSTLADEPEASGDDFSPNADTQNSALKVSAIEVTDAKTVDSPILHGNSRAASAKTRSMSVELPGVDHLSDTLSKSLEFPSEEVTDSFEAPVITSHMGERDLDHAEIKAIPVLGEVVDNNMADDSHAVLHSSSSDV